MFRLTKAIACYFKVLVTWELSNACFIFAPYESRASKINDQQEALAIMTYVIERFLIWWNSLAEKNGKLKFRNQREAAEFVRKVHNENGGPNRKVQAMRKRYEDVKRARDFREKTGSTEDRGAAVL